MKLGSFTLSAIVSAVLMLGIGYLVPVSRSIVPTPTASVHKRIQQALAQPSTLTARNLPLRDVVARLSHRHQIPIALDYAALRAEGLTGNESVDLDVSRVPLRCLLHLVLRQVHLCYAIRDGAVIITTVEAWESENSKLVGKVYLLPPSLSSRSVGEGELADLIRSAIPLQRWAELGDPSELRVIPGSLLVIQTPDIHDEIRDRLSQLDSWRESPDSASPVYLSTWDREQSTLIEKLKQTVDIKLHEASLEDVCRHLSNKHDIPIVIDRKDLADLGLTLDVPVTVDLHDVPLDTALRKMLGSLDLGYYLLGGGVIEIVDGAAHGDESFTRAYFVGDLMDPRGDGAAYGLIQTLTDFVNPVKWNLVGWPLSVDLMDGKLLLVAADRRTHEEMELFLGELRDRLDPATPFADGSGRTPMMRKIEAALREPASLQFEDTLLDQVADQIAKTYGISVRHGHVAFDPFTVSSNTRITCSVEGKPLEEALRDALRPLGGDILIRDDTLWLDSVSVCDAHRIRRFYDAAQLVDADFGLLDEQTLVVVVESAVELMEGRSNEPRCVAVHHGILIAYENRDTQREIGRILAHLKDNSQRLRSEIETLPSSRQDMVKRLLQEIRSHVTPLREIPDDLKKAPGAPGRNMGLGPAP